MRYSKMFGKTRKQISQDEVSLNAQLLIKGGYINKELAGAYSLLPLGLKVVDKISNIVREEMDNIGGQEVKMTSLQDKNLWEKTNRWDDEIVDVWFKTKLKNGQEVGLGLTHEEPLTQIAKHNIASYRDLPFYPYQIQTKFRNELRAKSGILRGREFLMKDLYSFCKDQADLDAFYEKTKVAYLKVFERLGIGHVTYVTFASGGIFSKYSHEFQTICEAGEDIIYVDENKKIAINEEVYTDEVIKDLDLKKDDLKQLKAIEVGNIFKLGTKFSSALDCEYSDTEGNMHPVVMGSYGIGITRLLGTIVEVCSDEKGIIWPQSVAPYQIHLLGLNLEDAEIKAKAEKVYDGLIKAGKDVLFDDRENISAGEKFADSDLIGIPYRLVISKKSGDKIELKKRNEKESSLVDLAEVLNL